MEATQERVRKKVKVKKRKPPTFKNRLMRLLKHGMVSEKWIWNIMIYSLVLVAIVGILVAVWFRRPTTKIIRPTEEMRREMGK